MPKKTFKEIFEEYNSKYDLDMVTIFSGDVFIDIDLHINGALFLIRTFENNRTKVSDYGYTFRDRTLTVYYS